MTTKERNCAINLAVPKDLKEEFAKLANALGTNSANLLKMLMKNAVITKQVNLRVNPFDVDDWEIEPLDVSDWGKDFTKKSLKLTKEMSNLLTSKKRGV